METNVTQTDSALWTSKTDKPNPKPAVKAPTQEMDKEAFLKLLLTELKYQDPLNPVQDKEFIAQMAQFSSLEQMRNMGTTIARTASMALAGKRVKAVSEIDGLPLDGIVEAVMFKAGEAYLAVDGKVAKASSVEEVRLA
ncbi:MAG: hypothetical protein LBC41_05260 [Clostridiales bacterium]|nr:hypothetical protein [Clostridiales bacterium]MDR2750050.1 hypothetical protein [Clostridiales bacterium]